MAADSSSMHEVFHSSRHGHRTGALSFPCRAKSPVPSHGLELVGILDRNNEERLRPHNWCVHSWCAQQCMLLTLGAREAAERGPASFESNVLNHKQRT